MPSVQRLDRGELRKPKKLSNGFLKVDGYLSRVGVFEYVNQDGSTRRELRLPEEVFNTDSLESFAMLPVTDEHPPVFLDSSNTYAFQRGSLGETVRPEGKMIAGTLMVTDSILVAKAESGEAKEISLGYTCELEMTPGVTPEGEKYDCIQRSIRGNHVAIVPKGRAGPEARLRMDASGAAMVSAGDPAPTQKQDRTPEIKAMPIHTRIDGIDFAHENTQLDQAIKRELEKKDAAIQAMKDAAKEAKAEAEKAHAEADALKVDLDKRDAELKEAPTKLRAELTAKVALETKARKVLGSKVKLDTLKARDVHELVIAKLSPKLKLDGKSDEYVEARFDHLLESERATVDADERSASALARARKATADAENVDEDEDDEDLVDNHSDGLDDDEEEEDETPKKRGDSVDAYARMIAANRKAWQTPKEKA